MIAEHRDADLAQLAALVAELARLVDALTDRVAALERATGRDGEGDGS